MSYALDHDLMHYIEKLHTKGYKGLQKNIIDEMKDLGITTREAKLDYLNSLMLVKEDKIHSCYHFFDLLENLKHMSAG